MRPRIGLVLGAAALGGLTAASLAAGRVGPHTALQAITSASLLGSSGVAAPAHGLAPGWLLVSALPDLPVAAAPSQPPAAPSRVTVPTAGAAAPLPARSPLAAVLTALPAPLPAPAHLLPPLPTSPLPVSLPPLPAPGRHHHANGRG
jgi:hypothetical protein